MNEKAKQKRKNGNKTIYLKKDLRDWLEAEAQKRDRSVSNFTRRLLNAKRKEIEENNN